MAKLKDKTKRGEVSDEMQEILRLVPGYDPFVNCEGCWFDEETARRALEFFPQCLHHVEGAVSGQPFELEPWQQAIVANLFGWKRKDSFGREVRRYRETLIYVPRKNGKALALDTPIPTPDGWKQMGDLKAGDYVFDHEGKPTRIVAAFPTLHNRKCYRVRFSDGESIVCDAEHLWETDSRRDRDRMKGRCNKNAGPKPSVKTTEEIRNTLRMSEDKVEWNHRIPVAGSLRTVWKELEINPYVLGVWLGDGDSDCARITNGEQDDELLTHVIHSGCTATIQRKDSRSSARRVLMGRGWLQKSLRNMCLLNNKHIPQEYLRASPSQRMALLQGLMDTDGYCSKAGQCEFTTTSTALRDGFMELARSLGYKPQLKTARSMIDGRDVGEKYRIQFFGYSDRPVFRLKRKKDRLKKWSKANRSAYRQIVAVEEVESVPVRCIAVDNPRKLYLAGQGMIPTHNTPLAAGIAAYVFFCDNEKGQQDYIAAGDREQAGMLFRQLRGMVEQEPELESRCEVYGGASSAGQSKSIVSNSPDDRNSFLRVISADASGKHGGNTHLAIIDELHVQPNRDLVDVISTSMASANRKQPLLIYITTADYARPSICNEKHEYACKVRDGIIIDPSFLPVVYETTAENDWTQEDCWEKSNPNLGVSVSMDYLRRECQKARENPAYENTFKRLHLNMKTEQAIRAIPMDAWDKCGQGEDPAQWRLRKLEEHRTHSCVGGIDLGSTNDLTALALLFGNDEEGYDLLPWFWATKDGADRRERKDRVPYRTWAQQGYIILTEGNETDYARVRKEVNEICDKYPIVKLAGDRLFQGVQFLQDLTKDGFDIEAFGQGYVSMAAPTRRMLELIHAGKMRHGNNPVLRWMASNCAAEAESGNAEILKFSKAKSTEKIDGIIAATMGLGMAMKLAGSGRSVYEERGIPVW